MNDYLEDFFDDCLFASIRFDASYCCVIERDLKEAYGPIIESCLPEMRRRAEGVCRRFGLDPNLADDFLQNFAISFLYPLDSIVAEERLAVPWEKRRAELLKNVSFSVCNACKSYLKRERRRRLETDYADGACPLDDLCARYDPPRKTVFDQFFKREDLADVVVERSALDRWLDLNGDDSPVARDVFILIQNDGASLDEITSIVDQRYFRASPRKVDRNGVYRAYKEFACAFVVRCCDRRDPDRPLTGLQKKIVRAFIVARASLEQLRKSYGEGVVDDLFYTVAKAVEL